MVVSPSPRLDELLFTRATEGLDESAAAELERLLADEPQADVDRYDRPAAVVCLAVVGASSMPPRLRAKLAQQLMAQTRRERTR